MYGIFNRKPFTSIKILKNLMKVFNRFCMYPYWLVKELSYNFIKAS